MMLKYSTQVTGMEENVHRLKVQEETSKRFSLLLNICSLNSVQSMLLKKWELLRVQGGRRPAPATARRAEENDKSHSRDEHVQFFKVGFLVSVGHLLSGNPCIKPKKRSGIWRRTMSSSGAFSLFFQQVHLKL